ncbi:hypothetical protein KPL71_022099 [Citrus sinensis]|uniref:Uncharacterized protein n=1 Tax=Citrus sinensis TaxID=2711 RepID=A0ACB8JL26_CITSI|nr:hypothetical protein KPL71_022099 [Citrus sinensis]
MECNMEVGILEKVKVFMWRAAQDLLPTAGNLWKKKALQDPWCQRCGKKGENVFHVVIKCKFSQKVWNQTGFKEDLEDMENQDMLTVEKSKKSLPISRREVMDALIQIDLDVVLKNKRHLYDEEIWDRMNEKACGQIRSCLTKEVKYLVKDKECAVTLWRTLEEKYPVKSPENRLHAMSQVYGFRMKPGVSMHDHVSRFEKLLADLKNLNEDIEDEVKAMILLHSLPEEYSHFVTTLIYGKSVIIFKDVCTALTNLEIRNNNKNSERASSETLVSRDWGHWRKDCPKAQKRYGKKPAAANMARKDEDSNYSLSITPAAYVASSSEWILDTGATYHLCPIKEWFTDFSEFESGAVMMGSDQLCRTMGIGTIRLKMFDGIIRELKEVRFVPALKKNRISVGALEDKGYKVTIEDGIMKFTHGAMVILQGAQRHNLYYLKGGTTNEANVVEAHSDTTNLWQKKRVKFGTTNHDTHEIIEYVHSDVCGPTKTASIGGSHYFVTFVDDFSRRVWVYTMRAKDEVLEIFVKWKKLVETQTGRKIKVLRSDNEGEYTSDPFLQVCQNEGIKRYFTVRHTPQQNGVADRMNHTLLEKVRCMLSNAGLDKKFWVEAVSYTSHLVNRLSSAAIGGKTPMEIWSGKHAQDYDSLRIFGCPAYYHVKDGKLDPRARKAIFVGFKGGVKGFKLWDLEDKKFVCSRDVTFDEASMMKASSSQQVDNKTKEVLQWVEFDATPYVPVSSTSKKSSTMEVTPRVEEEVVSSDVPQNEETIDDVDNDDFISTMRPRREIKKPGWLTKDMVVAYSLSVIDDDIPNTFGEALCSSESDQWKLAMEEEMKSLHQNQTWELVELPKGKRAIGNKWVYTKKQGSPNQLTPRYKARLVAKGFAQKECIDYNEVFSPVVKHTSIRILLALVAEYELELAQLDVKTTFLHGDLEDEIYMIQPCGFRVAGKENHMCRSQEERDYMARVPYASAVGSLMYAMVCTRPDISQAVSMVSRYMHNPGKNQWLAVKWILRYLYETVDVGLLFKKDCGQQCVGYCDSDFAGDLDKRRSTTGYVFTLGGGPVSWRSILQSTIALSTTEAEYMATTEVVKKAIWLKGLLSDLGVIQENIAVFCDNQSAIFLAKNLTYHARTKHIDVKYHYVREIIESGVVLLRKINTKDNPSDMLTKVVSGVKRKEDPRLPVARAEATVEVCRKVKVPQMQADGKQKSNNELTCKPPPEGYVKINTDAAIYMEEQKVGLGIIIRDSKGDFVAAAMKTSKFIDNIAYAEAEAIHLGMNVAEAVASGPVIVESDCSEVVNQILGRTRSNLELLWIISDIQKQMQRVKDIKMQFTPRICNGAAHDLAEVALKVNDYVQWICCCMKSSRPAKAANRGDRKGHTASGSGKTTMPDGQRNGETKKDEDHPSWIPAANSSNGEANQSQDYMGRGSLSEEKKPDRVVETVSRSDEGQGWLKDKRESSFESFEDKIPNTPEGKFGSPEADLSRKQQKGHSPMKTLGTPEIQRKVYPPRKTEVQRNVYPPTKTLGSPEVQQKVYPPMKTLGGPEVQQKLYPPTKTLGSPEVSHLLSNEPKKANPPTKTVRSADAGGNFLSKEQQKIESPRKTGSSIAEAGQVWSKEKQKIEPPRKTFSSPQESQLLSNEKQKGLIKENTSYGNFVDKQLDSQIETSNTPKQGGHLRPKEQDKEVMQKSINRERNYADSSPSKITNRSSGNQLEE